MLNDNYSYQQIIVRTKVTLPNVRETDSISFKGVAQAASSITEVLPALAAPGTGFWKKLFL